MIDNFQGDPKIFLGENGSYLKFIAGQSIMDQGFENPINILLFTRKGWSGNALVSDPNDHIGSDFEKATEQALNLNTFNDIRKQGLLALKQLEERKLVKDIEIKVSNPVANELHIEFEITSLEGDLHRLLLVKNGINWYYQDVNPANRKK